MSLFEVAVVLLLAVIAVLCALCLLKISRVQPPESWGEKLESIDLRLNDNIQIVQLGLQGMRQEAADAAKSLRDEVGQRFNELGSSTRETLRTLGSQLTDRLDGFGTQLTDHRKAATDDAKSLRAEVNNSLLKLGQTVEDRLDKIRVENTEKLEEMRVTVDEKLQGTLEQRLGASFNQVNESLKRVFESVGEMQALATGVGDLKRVLSNVKLRGTLGEGALGDILDDMLTPEQFSRNVEVRPQSGQYVEFALKLPGSGDTPVWVPIDSKLPHEDYDRLKLASERGDPVGVEESARALERCILKYAKDISAKYVCPPHSTDFAILFLPSEGIFAEVIRRPGLADKLRHLRVAVTCPTTLTAYLNALRMGFKSLAIQQRSSEVWQVLGAVKTEFDKFGTVLDKVHKKLGEAQNAVEDAHQRRRVMNKKLRDVEALPEAATQDLLSITTIAQEAVFEEDETAQAAE
jgi:DNA recombination protein RmuC